MARIGIYGGTFNPVHGEHVAVAKNAARELGLDKIFIVPTYAPPHKKERPISAEDRLSMLSLAFGGVENALICDYEIKRGGKSYTYLTVEHFKEEYGEDELFLIVGADMLVDFKTWKDPARILENCTLCAFKREGVIIDEKAEREYFLNTFGKNFVMLSYVGKNVSSTLVRAYASFGLRERGVDEKVFSYIEEKGLYKDNPYAEEVKKRLTEKRLYHTAGVVGCALEKYEKLGLDKEKVIAAATLHDIAKYMNAEDFKDFTPPEGVPAPVMHAFLGAHYIKTRLGVTDEDVIDAVRYHTSGKAGMSTLGKLVFVADMIEENRSYGGVEKLREAYEGDFEECFKACLREEMSHLIAKKCYVFKETIAACEYYLGDKEKW